MRIIFPTNNNNGLNSKRSSHFGKAAFYIVVITKPDGQIEVETINNSQEESHSCGSSASKILSNNPNALVVGGIGARPAQIFTKANLDVFIDRDSTTIKESLELFLENKLELLGNQGTCSHH